MKYFLMEQKQIYKMVGNIGDVGCFSLYPVKLSPIGTGLIVENFNDVKLANYTKQMRFLEETSGDEVFC